jgi:hypothetical protein
MLHVWKATDSNLLLKANESVMVFIIFLSPSRKLKTGTVLGSKASARTPCFKTLVSHPGEGAWETCLDSSFEVTP